MAINIRLFLSLLVRTCLFLALADPALLCAAQGRAPTRHSEDNRSPESCVAEIDKLFEGTFRDARNAGHQVDMKALQAGTAKIANGCLSSLSIASVRRTQLAALSRLYLEAHQDDNAYAAISRYVNSRVPNAGKAEVLLRAIYSSLSPDWFPETVHQSTADAKKASYAEAYLKKIESLGPGFVVQQMRASVGLAKHYLIAGNNIAALKHESRLIGLSSKLKAKERTGALAEAVGELSKLAMMRCSVDGPHRGRLIIEQIPGELVRLSGNEAELSTGMKRYSLAGKPPPQIHPRFTLNGTVEDNPSTGHVTVMLFAAHWCGPCEALYPEVAAIYANFRAQGLRVLLVTRLYGFFGDRKELKPEEEAAAVRDYYVVKKKLPFPILIEDAVEKDPKNAAAEAVSREHAYLYSFLPQVLVIDKKGATRAILLGTLPGQVERLRSKVEELLKEPTPPWSITRQY